MQKYLQQQFVRVAVQAAQARSFPAIFKMGESKLIIIASYSVLDIAEDITDHTLRGIISIMESRFITKFPDTVQDRFY